MRALEARQQLKEYFPEEYRAYERLAVLLHRQDIPSDKKGRITRSMVAYLKLPGQRAKAFDLLDGDQNDDADLYDL